MRVPISSWGNLVVAARRLSIHGVLLLLCCVTAWSQQVPSSLLDYTDQWCSSCHNAKKAKGGLSLESLMDADPDEASVLEVWLKMYRRVQAGEMPPAPRKQPPVADRSQWLENLDRLIDRSLENRADPWSPVRIRRLSRFEYGQTITHLFGVSAPVELLPPDNLAYGFDTIGEALAFSELHVEKFLNVAERVAQDVIITEDPENPEVRQFEAESMDCTVENAQRGDVASLYQNGTVSGAVRLPRDGRYRIEVSTYATQAGKELAKVRVHWDRKTLDTFEVDAERRQPKDYAWEGDLKGGTHKLSASFINDYYDPKNKDKSRRDRNLYVDWLRVTGPLDARPHPMGMTALVASDPGRGTARQRATSMLKPLLKKVFRRPVTSKDLGPYLDLVDSSMESGASLLASMRTALSAALASPRFLLRSEPVKRGATLRPVDSYAMASRLSYFLWSGPPDADLLKDVRKGRLGKRESLLEVASRMLEDPKADALARNFAAQWLDLRSVDDAMPDEDRFGPMDATLRDALKEEAIQFFLDSLRRDVPVSSLLAADYTFLNERLARHYGIRNVTGDQFRRVELGAARPGGLLGQGAIHLLTSNPTRTSPVKRGKWVLDTFLGSPPPPPPPGVEGLPEPKPGEPELSFREQMARHRNDVRCIGCHARMDALGFAMEHFGPTGLWRDVAEGGAVEAHGELPEGLRIEGLSGLQTYVKTHPMYLRSIATALFVFSHGRSPETVDVLAIEKAARKWDPSRVNLSDIILDVIALPSFHLVSATSGR